MPDITEVANFFITRYNWNFTGERDIRFEKRPSGWFVVEYERGPEKVAKRPVKIWDKTSSVYVSAPFDLRPIEDSLIGQGEASKFIERTLDELQLYHFRRNLFFGYEGWDWDVIKDLNDKPLLTDSLYEALNLAASHYAQGYINVLAEKPFINGDVDRTALADSIAIPKSRIAKFIKYQDKSLAALVALAKLNPGYKLHLCEARLAPAVGKMQSYVLLQMLEYEQEASKYLRSISFPDSILRSLTKILNEIAPNSIILGQETPNTYALLYLQSKGFRKDIIIIEEPLLAQRRFLQYLSHKQPESFLGTEPSIYMDSLFNFSLFLDDRPETEPIPLDTFLHRLHNSLNVTTRYTNDLLFKFFTKEVYLPIDQFKAQALYGKNQYKTRLRIPIENNYLIIDEMMWLSIINRNFLNRKIYYLYPYYKDLHDTGLQEREGYWEQTPF